MYRMSPIGYEEDIFKLGYKVKKQEKVYIYIYREVNENLRQLTRQTTQTIKDTGLILLKFLYLLSHKNA